MNISKKKLISPPNLLKGILVSCIGATLIILVTVWFTINHQVEQLVINRTSEYAHSIAKLAADSSAEALLSEDLLQLNLLVENVARDPYIRQATIFSEDGQIVSQFPTSEQTVKQQVQPSFDDELPNIDTDQKRAHLNAAKDKQQQIFIAQQNNIPFIEKIAYQNLTAGWFKLEIDRNLLEIKFRESFHDIQIIIGGVAFIILSLLTFILFRLENKIKSLANNCQHLLIQNKITPPKSKSAWLSAIKELSDTHPQQLKEHINLPHQSDQWMTTRKVEEALVCFIDFSLPLNHDEQFAEQLTLAEGYLSKAAQAYGIQTQGDLLSGCLIPFENSPADQSLELATSNALGFIVLTRRLLNSLNISIKFRAALCKTSLLLLEDEHDLITGVSVANSTVDRVRKAFLEVKLGNIISLSLNKQQLENLANPVEITIEGINKAPCFLLNKISSDITKQNNLKFKHIAIL